MLDLKHASLTTPEPKKPGSKDCMTYKPGSYPVSCPYFVAAEDGSYADLFAPTKGASTKNTPRTRTELRETDEKGNKRNFKHGDNPHHFLRLAMSVNQVCKKGRVTIGQVHCDGSTEPMLKVFYQTNGDPDAVVGDVVASFRKVFGQDDPVSFVVQRGVPLGRRFGLSVHLTKIGSISVNSSFVGETGEAQSGNWNDRLDTSYADVDLYFKGGLYNQEDADEHTTDEEGSRSRLYRLEFSHGEA